MCISTKLFQFFSRVLPNSFVWGLMICLAFYNPDTYAKELLFKQISIPNGLPNSTVFVIHQDQYGFMWFGTREGLVRYDGIHIKEPWLPDSGLTVLKDRMITGIAEDENGNLYVSVWGAGIFYYNRHHGKLSVLCTDDRDGQQWCARVWVLRRTSYGILVAGTQGYGTYFFDPENGQWNNAAEHSLPEDPGSTIRAIEIDSIGSIWFASDEKGLSRWSRTKSSMDFWKINDRNTSINRLVINTIAFHEQEIWVGTSVGLFKHSSGSAKVLEKVSIDGFHAPDIRSIVAVDNTMWLGTDGNGLLIFDATTGISKQHTFSGRPNGLSSAVIFKLFKSLEGHLWIGTNKGGVNVHLSSNPRISISDKQVSGVVSGKMVMAVLSDKTGNLWLGTDGAGVYRIRGGQSRVADQFFNAGKVVKTIFEDSRGNLYFGTYGEGMCVLTPSGKWFNFRDIAEGRKHRYKDVWAFAEDADGMIWVGTLNDGILLFDKVTMRFVAYENADRKQIPSTILALIYHPGRRSLIAGTLNGIFEIVYDGNKLHFKKVFFDKDKLLADAEVKALFIDEKGNTWAGTRSRGLYQLDGHLSLIRRITKADGLSSNSVASVRADRAGHIWVSGSSGLSRIDREDGTIMNYTASDGLQVQEYLSESAVLMPDGDLIFGGVYGIDRFDPAHVGKSTFEAPVYFTRLLAMNEEVVPVPDKGLLQSDIAFQETIRLLHHQNTFSLEFIVLNYAAPEDGAFAYRLEGFDKNWNHIGSQRRVTFTNLDPGTYKLRVKASNADGVWSQNEGRLTVVIVPPWWQTGIARLLFVISMMGIIALFVLRRLRAEALRRKELESIVKIRTTELEEEKKRVENQNLVLQATRDELLSRNSEIIKQKEEIERISRQLHEADQLKLSFFTTISHEIRTPLTLMMSPLHEVLKRYSNEDHWLQAQLLTLNRNLMHLLELVDQLLDFQRLEQHDQKLQAFPHNINQLLAGLCSDAGSQAQAAGIELQLITDPSLPDVWIDVARFQKIIFNLLSNALKFTPKKGKITIETLLAEQKTEGADYECVMIRVTDTGIGFPPDEAERIFDSFYQSNNSRLRGFGGTGIGLSIARSMAALHHGSLVAKAPETGGAVFELSIPIGEHHLNADEKLITWVQLPPEMSSGAIQHETKSVGNLKRSGRAGRKPTLLLVEDNAELRHYISEHFSMFYSVYTASDGHQGWDKMQSVVPDIVVSDIIMPVLDGIGLLRRIKSNGKYAHIPVILLTAKTLIADKLEGLGYGADDYMGKPFMLDELRLRIDNILAAREKLRQKLLLTPWTLAEVQKLESDDAHFLEKLNEVLLNEFANEHFGVPQLVESMGMSRTALHTRLKRVSGLSASEWIKHFRLGKAAEMLKNERSPVSEVGWRCGLPDIAYFIRLFRQHFGITPGVFRENYIRSIADEQ